MKDSYVVKSYRALKNITQDEMANKLNISRATYINWENEPKKLSLYKLFSIINVLELDEEETKSFLFALQQDK